LKALDLYDKLELEAFCGECARGFTRLSKAREDRIMNRRSIWPPIYVAGLLLVVGVLAISGPQGSSEAHGQVTFAFVDTIPDLTGTWVGTWADTVYLAGGSMTWEISRDGSDYTASGTIDFTYFGMGLLSGSAEGNITSAFADHVMEFTFEAAMIGNGSGTINGNIGSGGGTVTAPLNFGEFTFEGVVVEGNIAGTFDFTSPTGGAGIASLTKQTATERSTWGDIKALYRGSSD
jgi:hypothetical protein